MDRGVVQAEGTALTKALRWKRIIVHVNTEKKFDMTEV